jgi:hypothetical protein
MATYTFPKVVLDFIRAIAPHDIKGEIRDSYVVTLQEFGLAFLQNKQH